MTGVSLILMTYIWQYNGDVTYCDILDGILPNFPHQPSQVDILDIIPHHHI